MRRRIEENLLSTEKDIKKRIADAEEELSLERKKVFALDKELAVLEHDLKVLSLTDEEKER
jgi:hypothetical protein